MIETWIEMAWRDGSFGWCGIANLPSTFAAGAYLLDDGFAEVFSANDNRVTMGGQFFPNGQGEAVNGGYRLTGAWSFGSGTGHSEYIAAGFMPMDNGEVRWISEGLPDMQVAIVPRDDITFTDGWFVQGLKGTGSAWVLCPSPPPVTHRGRSVLPRACSTMSRNSPKQSSG
jgi:hypothetical protein